MGWLSDLFSIIKDDYSSNSSEDVQKMMENMYEFSSKVQANRENQRNVALGAWRDMLGKQQKYETPASVGKYVDLMFDLGGELSQLRDPSNKTNIDYNKYKTGIKNYDQITGGDLSNLDKYLNEISSYTNTDKPGEGIFNNPNKRNGGRTYKDDIHGMEAIMRNPNTHAPQSNPREGYYYINSPGDNMPPNYSDYLKNK